jgi:hypothetical protein
LWRRCWSSSSEGLVPEVALDAVDDALGSDEAPVPGLELHAAASSAIRMPDASAPRFGRSMRSSMS